ncbi:MAG: helix-turn-helix transcriptional regulator [Candidatus Thiodiazotropha taylori]
MDIKTAFAKALRTVRNQRGLTQEDFSMVSSRTYLSTLERGKKSPTLEKIEALAGRMNVHPVTLLVITYLQDKNSESLDDLLKLIADEVNEINRDEN